jgi:hypothetical protein
MNCPKLSRKKLLCIPALFLMLAFLISFQPVRAQGVVKITAIPPRLEIDNVDPGEVIAEQLKVRNEGDSQIALEVKVQDFIVSDGNGTPLPVEDDVSNRWAASLWITVSPQKVVLNPGETKTLDLVAVIPEDAHPGGHYAIVFYSPAENISLEQTSLSVSPNVGTLTYFTVSGDVSEDARVSKMDVNKFQEYGPIKIDTEVLNLSDVHLKPQGVIKIYDMLGNLKTTLALEEKNIFPGVSRLYENNWQQKWGLGKYKANLEASYGSQGKLLSATVFFWIVPWRIITIAILVVVLITLLIVYFKRPGQTQVLEEEQEPSK